MGCWGSKNENEEGYHNPPLDASDSSVDELEVKKKSAHILTWVTTVAEENCSTTQQLSLFDLQTIKSDDDDDEETLQEKVFAEEALRRQESILYRRSLAAEGVTVPRLSEELLKQHISSSDVLDTNTENEKAPQEGSQGPVGRVASQKRL